MNTRISAPNLFLFFKGRVAFYAILKAIGLAPGDEVILPGFTCVVVPNAITYLGAKPVYIDIEPTTYNLDPEKIEHEKEKSWYLDKAKAIVVQHTFGIPADMDKLAEIAERYNLYVIEDCCHAIGSRYNGQDIGSFGDAAFFSSQWTKPVTTGLGGWAVSNNEDITRNLERIYPEFMEPSLREVQVLKLQYLLYSIMYRPALFWFAQGAYRALSRLGLALGSSTNEELECRMPKEYEKRMSRWQEAILRERLSAIDEIIAHRKRVSSWYELLLEERGIETLGFPENYDPVLLRYPIPVKKKRDFLEAAKKGRIEIGDWFLSPVHPNTDGWEKVGYERGSCPIAETVCQHLINLPIHQWIDRKETMKTVDFLSKWVFE
jgi:perosamine synthetase